MRQKDTASDPTSKHELKKDENTGIFSIDLKEAKIGSLYKYMVDGKGPFPDPASRYTSFQRVIIIRVKFFQQMIELFAY